MAADRPDALGMGCNKLGSAAVGMGQRDAVRLVQEAIDAGITFFDTADVYGNGTSERVLGEALRGHRAHVQVATKGGYLFNERSGLQQRLRAVAAPALRTLRARRAATGSGPASVAGAYAQQSFAPDVLAQALDASLRRLQTDHIEMYQLHGPEPQHVEQFAEFAGTATATGKVGALGVGLNSIVGAAAWLDAPGLRVIQLPLGILDPDAADWLVPEAESRGIRLVVRGIYGAGLLSPRRTSDELRRATPKWPVIAEVHALAARQGTTALQLAAWYVRWKAPAAQWIVGINNTAQLHSGITNFTAAAPGSPVLDELQAMITSYRQLLSEEGGDIGG